MDIMLNDINVDLGGIVLLEDTNVTFVYGRRYGLIGKNGSGKVRNLLPVHGCLVREGVLGRGWRRQFHRCSKCGCLLN